MTWDFTTEPEFQRQLDWIRNFVDEHIVPLELVSTTLDQQQLNALLAPYKERVRAQGLWATHLPPADGGQGLGQLKLALIHEVLGRSLLAPEVFGNQAPDSGNAELIAAGADDVQRERWLYPLMRGELRSSFALTEPHNAGSDPTAITTRCERDGEQWVLNGEKWFASNASVADFLVVMAVTDPQAPPHRRAAMLIVPRGTPGLEILRDVGTMAHPTTDDELIMTRVGGHSHLRFSNCRVPLDHMIGEPGDGFVLAQKRLSGGRIHHAMRMVGQAWRAYEMTAERAVSRQTRGKPLAAQQMVQAMIADSWADLQTARLLTLKAAWTMDNGDLSAQRLDISMVKYKVPELLLKILDRAIQIHGSLGYSSDLPLEEMYRQARALRIADGADELHKQTMARLLLKNVPAVEGWPSQHLPTRRRAAREKLAAELEAARGKPAGK